MRILFMGTPEFAAESLNRLVAEGHEICGIFCRPDKPRGRGMKLAFPPVKEAAERHGIPVFQPSGLKGGDAAELIESLGPELIAVVAYGRILPENILAYPRFGCVNVHGSILPKYRGAAPIQRAVINGETETGVTTMYMAKELDAGDIIYTAKTVILPEDTAGSVHDRLMALGAELLAKTVRDIGNGSAPRVPQDGSKATYAPMLSKEGSRVVWARPAPEILNLVRGSNPWPVAFSEIDGRVIKIFSALLLEGGTEEAPGMVVGNTDGLDVACGGGSVIRILDLQAGGGRRMAGADYLRGHPVGLKTTFTTGG